MGATLSPVVMIHLMMAVAVVGLGATIFFLRKGTPTHKLLGCINGTCMMTTAVTSFGIKGIGGFVWGFSWIHMLSIFTLFSLVVAIVGIRRGDVRRHKSAMIGIYVGFIGAGAFALAPGRLLNELLFAS